MLARFSFSVVLTGLPYVAGALWALSHAGKRGDAAGLAFVMMIFLAGPLLFFSVVLFGAGLAQMERAERAWVAQNGPPPLPGTPRRRSDAEMTMIDLSPMLGWAAAGASAAFFVGTYFHIDFFAISGVLVMLPALGYLFAGWMGVLAGSGYSGAAERATRTHLRIKAQLMRNTWMRR